MTIERYVRHAVPRDEAFIQCAIVFRIGAILFTYVLYT